MATAAATLVLKELVDAERPNGEDQDSFPSGHVSMSAASAVFLQKRYGWQYGLPAFFATALIAHNRLENDHHRPVDVAVSLALAYTINEKVTSPIVITPRVSVAGVGIQLSASF